MLTDMEIIWLVTIAVLVVLGILTAYLIRRNRLGRGRLR
jgi:hypothetical protein